MGWNEKPRAWEEKGVTAYKRPFFGVSNSDSCEWQIRNAIYEMYSNLVIWGISFNPNPNPFLLHQNRRGKNNIL